MTGAGGNPFLVDVIVDHHAGTGGRDTLLWSLVTETGGGLVVVISRFTEASSDNRPYKLSQ